MYDGLITLGSSGEHITDMTAEQLIRHGAVAGNMTDLWDQFFDAQNINPGSFNDRAWEYLGANGYHQGTLTERWAAFWCAMDLPEAYQPLESHPDWYNLQDIEPSNTRIDENRRIYSLPSTTTPDQFIAYSTNEYRDVVISAFAGYESPGTDVASYGLAVRGSASGDFIGITSWNGKLRIYEYSAGHWTELLSNPPSNIGTYGRRIRLSIAGSVVVMTVAGVEYMADRPATLLNPGRVGIVSRVNLIEEVELIRYFLLRSDLEFLYDSAGEPILDSNGDFIFVQ
jgi:hypothetical protein